MRFTTNKIIATGLVGLSLMATTLHADDKKVVATVNGVEITQDTLDAVSGMVSRSTQGNKVDNKALLDDLIITELARQEANKAGLAERQEIKDKVKDVTDKLVLNTWTQEKAASFKPSDEELKKAYDERTGGENKYEYKARHILMKTKEEAEAIIKELESGVDFADLAKKKSTGPSAPTGGDLGWFKADAMVKPFSEAIAKMEPGTISKEPVQTQFGWHVIKLEERRDAKPPSFEEMKPQLEREFEQKKMLEYMQELRSKADVKTMLPEEKAADAPKPEEKPADATKADAPKPEEKPATEAKPEDKPTDAKPGETK
ncbi:peptidylprolyl isomerase [Candidatus Thiothrix sp. Deng01]|uniref:peptidylprolyl isomerase n=1 Tax=Candidatus Thiothrix phosphatis TaxID=3112415 RepID=A0ABU6CWX3_9GAMM|nr:peptidylprolyl isomerase [Candidatus Thiothrix sp. Deng01]MEB4590903.1 peptidylprolyl isomerase [Candidatus Thiothrix sp. Deng01]